MKNLNLEYFGKKSMQDDYLWVGIFKLLEKRKLLKPESSVIDIGGSSGAFLMSLKKYFNDIKIDGTVIDVDNDCIEYGKQKYSELKFINDDFLNYNFDNKKFDFSFINALFPQLVEWKKCLFKMASITKKYMIFQSLLTFGNTIENVDFSYTYYLNSGKRVPQNIFNVFDIFNFLCIEEIRAKKILCISNWVSEDPLKFKGKIIDTATERNIHIEEVITTVNMETGVFRSGLYQISASFFVELFSEAENPKRMGGYGNIQNEDYKFFIPDIQMFLNPIGEVFCIQDGKRYMSGDLYFRF